MNKDAPKKKICCYSFSDTVVVYINKAPALRNSKLLLSRPAVGVITERNKNEKKRYTIALKRDPALTRNICTFASDWINYPHIDFYITQFLFLRQILLVANLVVV